MRTEDMNTLQVLDSILRDNMGNRLTPALINGLVNTLHDHIKTRPPMPDVQAIIPPQTGATT